MSSNSGASPSIPVVPFCPDGGCSALGWVLMLGANTAAGAALGLLVGYISQWFYLVLLFPIGMGVAIGFAGMMAIKAGKVRSPWLTVFAACLGAAATAWGMHYSEYQMFLANRLREVTDADLVAMMQVAENLEELKRNPEGMDQNLKDFVKFLDEDPVALRSLRIKSFWDFVDFEAVRGVTISKTGAGGGGGMNLGYWGSYVYWAVEWAIMAGLAIAIMWSAASDPFCLGCQNWKDWQPLGCVIPDPTAAKEALASGNLEALARLSPVACAGSFMVTASVCHRCGEQSPADLKLEEVKLNEKGEPVRTHLLLVTYPGESLAMVRKLFDDGAARAIAEAEAAEAAEAAAAEGKAEGDDPPEA